MTLFRPNASHSRRPRPKARRAARVSVAQGFFPCRCQSRRVRV